MPTVNTVTKLPIPNDDALRVERARHDVPLAAASGVAAATDVEGALALDVIDEDPYCNVACTD